LFKNLIDNAQELKSFGPFPTFEQSLVKIAFLLQIDLGNLSQVIPH